MRMKKKQKQKKRKAQSRDSFLALADYLAKFLEEPHSTKVMKAVHGKKIRNTSGV